MKSEIITAQIELEYLLKTVSEDAPEVVAAKSKLASLQKEYNKFQTNSDEIFVGFKDAPLLGCNFLINIVKLKYFQRFIFFYNSNISKK